MLVQVALMMVFGQLFGPQRVLVIALRGKESCDCHKSLMLDVCYAFRALRAEVTVPRICLDLAPMIPNKKDWMTFTMGSQRFCDIVRELEPMAREKAVCC